MGIKHPFVSSVPDAAAPSVVKPSNWNADHTIDGDVDFLGHAITGVGNVTAAGDISADEVSVTDEAYNPVAWDGDLTVPTKNAIRDKIEALVLSGGGVTDFLGLADTPNTYPSTQARSSVQVNTAANALEFKYGNSYYLDVRDFGSLSGTSGDITTALQAALDACYNFGSGAGGTQTVMVPPGNWTVSAPITFNRPGVQSLRLQLYGTLLTSHTLNLRNGSTVLGFARGAGNIPYPYETRPEYCGITSTANPAINLAGHNCRLEGLFVHSTSGPAILGQLIDLTTIKDCYLTSGNGCALKLDNCFWMLLERLVCEPSLVGNPYAIELTTDINSVGNFGLCNIFDLIMFRNGILLRSKFGSSGLGTTTIRDVHTESMTAGNATFTFDSSFNNTAVSGIHIYNAGNSDALGNTYMCKNVGPRTSGIFIESWNTPDVFDPAGDAVQNCVIDCTKHDEAKGGMPGSLTGKNIGTSSADSSQMRTAGAIDARLLTAPVGLPWTIFTPLPVAQNPANWLSVAGGVITTGLTGPDGSTMAARVAGGGGATCYVQNHTVALNDYIVFGVWMRNPNPTGFIREGGSVRTGIEFFSFPVPTRLDGSGGPLNETIEDTIPNYGWRWVCRAQKITVVGNMPGTLTFRFCPEGTTRDFFQPCMTLIPAATAALLDDVWIANYARSLKGGWSSAATTGNVSLPDHQILQLGAAAGSVTGGLQTNKIITPKSGAKTIAAGVITATGSYCRVETEGLAATDDLDTILGGVDGYRLVLLANNVGRTIVCKDGTGNLVLAGDFSLDNTQDTIELIFDAGLAAWLELGRSDNGA